MAAAGASGGICRPSARRVGKRISQAGAAESPARSVKSPAQAKRRSRFFNRNPQAAPLPLPPSRKGRGLEVSHALAVPLDFFTGSFAGMTKQA
jgi:hypothetical protein